MLNKNSIWDKSKDVQGTRACGINTMGEKVRKGTAGLTAAGQSGCLCKIVQICLRLSPIVDGRLFLFTIQQKRMGLTYYMVTVIGLHFEIKYIRIGISKGQE